MCLLGANARDTQGPTGRIGIPFLKGDGFWRPGSDFGSPGQHFGPGTFLGPKNGPENDGFVEERFCGGVLRKYLLPK